MRIRFRRISVPYSLVRVSEHLFRRLYDLVEHRKVPFMGGFPARELPNRVDRVGEEGIPAQSGTWLGCASPYQKGNDSFAYTELFMT